MSATTDQCPERPYVGATVIQDPRLFYGREVETDAVVDNLLAYRILLLFSPSGAGKSSLIESGVKPRLADDFNILPSIRVNRLPKPGQIPDGMAYNRFTFSALLSLHPEAEVQPHAVASSLAGMSLAEYLEKHDVKGERSGRTLLIFDQFEELLTTDPSAKDEIAGFLEDLMAVLYDYRYWALFAMREDYLAELEPYLSYFPDRLSTHFYLKLLGKDAAAEAIVRPARLCGVEFEAEAAAKLVNDLSTRRVPGPNGVVEQPGDTVEPVQLQVVCANFWEIFRRDHPERVMIEVGDLPSLADIDNALAKHYDRKITEVVTTLQIPELGVRDWFDNELIANQSLRQQSLAGKEAEFGLTKDAVKMLMDGYLVREDTRLGTTWYELAHDRLIQPVCLSNAHWYNQNLPQLLRTARNWVRDKEPDDYLLSGKLLEEAEAWAQANPRESGGDVARFLVRSREAEKRHLQEITRAHETAINEVKQVETFKRLALQLESNKRQRWALIGLSIAIVLALAMAGLAVYYYRQSNQEGREARFNLSGQSGLISQNIPAGQALEKLRSAIQAMRVTGDHDEYESPEARHAAYDALASTGGLLLLDGLGEAVVMAGSPDGGLAVTNSADQVAVLDAGQINEAVTLGSSQALEGSLELSAPGTIGSLAYNPDGTLLAAGLLDGSSSVRVWDVSIDDPAGEAVDLAGHDGAVRAVRFSQDGNWLASAGDDATIRLWSTGDFDQAPIVLQGHEAAVTNLDFSARRRWLASGGDDGLTMLWDMLSGEPGSSRIALPDHEAAIKALAYSPDGRWLATGSGDGTARLWDTTAEDPSQAAIELVGHESQLPVNALAFHQGGSWLASASDDQTVCLWSLDGIEEVAQTSAEIRCDPRFTGHANSVLELVFDPSENWLASGDANGEVHLWGGPVDRSVVLARHTGAILSMVFDPGREWVATAGADGAVYLWGMQNSPVTTLPVLLPSGGSPLTSLAASPDGSWLIGLDPSGVVNGWRIETIEDGLEHLSPYQGAQEQASLASFAGYLGGGDAHNITQAVFHPGGRWLATGTQSGGVALWDLSQEQPKPQELPSRFNLVSSLAFNPAGDLLAAAGGVGDTGNFALQVYPLSKDVGRGDLIPDEPEMLASDLPPVNRILFSPDGRWLAVGGEAGFLQLWDLTNGWSSAAPHGLVGHQSGVLQLAFTSDSDFLISGSDDGQVLHWDLNDLHRPSTDLLQTGFQSDAGSPGAQQSAYLGAVNGLETSSDGRWLAVAHSFSDLAWLVDLEAFHDAINEPNQVGSAQPAAVYSQLDCGHASPASLNFITETGSGGGLFKRVMTALGFDDDLPAGTMRWLAVAYQDGGICVWDLRDPSKAPIVLNGDPVGVTDIAASPQGTWLASTGSDGRVHIWPLNFDVLYGLACRTFGDYLGDAPRESELQEIFNDCPR